MRLVSQGLAVGGSNFISRLSDELGRPGALQRVLNRVTLTGAALNFFLLAQLRLGAALGRFEVWAAAMTQFLSKTQCNLV